MRCSLKTLDMTVLLKILLFFIIQVVNVTSVSQKKGIIHMCRDWICGDELALDNIAWWYDYSPDRHFFDSKCRQCSPFKTSKKYHDTFVIMAWGISSRLVTFGHERFCMGFNEPNHMKQSNLTALQAAQAWPYLEEQCEGAKLISPSASVCGGDKCNDETMVWFDKFFKNCKNCRVDFIATHTFSCNAHNVMKYLEKLYKRYNKKIWLTEFTCSEQDNVEILKIFLKDILNRLEAAPFIYRYSWYKARITTDHFVKTAASLLKPDVPELTELGKIYNAFDGNPIPIEDDSSDDDVPDDKDTKDENDHETADDVDSRMERIIGVRKKEAMILAEAFTAYFTPWHILFYAIEKRLSDLPSAVAKIYMTTPKSEKKNRIRITIQKIICMDLSEIDDNDISMQAERIKNLEEKPKQKQALKRPEC